MDGQHLAGPYRLGISDHRNLTVRDWVPQAHSTLQQVTGWDMRQSDFTEDRPTMVLRYLWDEARWQAIEQELGQHLIRVYESGGAGDPPGCHDGVRVSRSRRREPLAVGAEPG